MNVTMPIEIPQGDLASLDQLRKNVSRSEYIRKLALSYLHDKSKMLELFDRQMKSFYEGEIREESDEKV